MVEAKDQEMCEGMQCVKHPFTKNPGGICAFCLQEKLGKLVTSSSFPLPKHLSSSSSSSSPSFRSDSLGPTSSTTTTLSVSNNNNLPFLLAKKKKKMLTTSFSSSNSNIVYKRSQSTRTYGDSDFTPRKRNWFWSFLHLYSSKHHSSTTTTSSKKVQDPSSTLSKTESSSASSSSSSLSSNKRVVTGRNAIDVIVEEDGSPVAVTPSERKVSRSRSVGCGSRSFSGDFFERITNGFGDCTLRRVESQREGNNNNNNKAKVTSNNNNGVREMVRCGGIFGGFMIMTSSSSSSSSSSWVSSSSTEHHGGRNRSWGWAFASPMRAFTSSNGKRGRSTISGSTSNNTTPNLDAIPSLLSVRS